MTTSDFGQIDWRGWSNCAPLTGVNYPRVKAEIVRELQRLELVLNMIKTVEAERDAIASAGKRGQAKRAIMP
jgi:hypothetical protein